MRRCPKCNSMINTSGTECPKCGIIFAKYRKRQLEEIQEKRGLPRGARQKKKLDKQKTQKPSLILILGGGFLVFCLFIVIFGELLGFKTSPPLSKTATTPQSSSVSPEARTGQLEENIGFQSSSFGSQGQSQALLKLINGSPGKADYTITYETDIDAVVFGCNLNNQVILRIHQRKDGHGTQEMWKGYTMDRLTNAAQSSTLNNTPAGKNMGTYSSF